MKKTFRGVFQKTATVIQRGGVFHLTITNDDTFGGLVARVSYKGKFQTQEAALTFARAFVKPIKEKAVRP